MLTTGDIKRIKVACDDLSLSRVLAISLAAAHRTVPVYQAYSEIHTEVEGYELTHDGLVGAWRVLRARPGASVAILLPMLQEAVNQAERDLDAVNGRDDFSLAEELAIESISSAVSALCAFIDESRKSAFDALLSALEVDRVWVEGEADRNSTPVSWDEVVRHYDKQIRDIGDLSVVDDRDESAMFRDIAMRAEREGMPFLLRMRNVLASEVS